MNIKRLLGATAVVALLSSAAWAQDPAAPAETARPAVVAPTPPLATPPEPAATTPPASSIVTPPATGPTPVTAAAPPVQVVAKGDIIETLKADGHFKTLLKALDKANMTALLKTNPNLTVFAPTDAAFAAMPAGELDRLMKSPAELQKLLTYHVVNASVDSTKIRGAKGGVKTVAGTQLVLDGSGPGLLANNATIVQTDVAATNGTVHVVDKVLSPTTAPSLAATTGATSDAAATTPAQPETPAAPVPPEASPAPPPTEAEPQVPETPKEPDQPPTPQAGLSCQAPPVGTLTPAQKRSIQEMSDETRLAKPDDLAGAPPPSAPSASTYGSDVATNEPMPAPTVVTNGPVPDTAGNRALYGQPMSRAGKRTAPRGN
jgi:uncharacterized surface protein with fasciclin (FAS1) repeats